MVDVPQVLLRFSILVFEAHTSWSEDVRHSVRPFPLWGELVTRGALLSPENKISRVELLGSRTLALIAA
jgi:hypothetical protein